MACFHRFMVPVVQPTMLGSLMLQLLFAVFEDRALIVGNAPNVMDAPFGAVMDEFASVSRFNTYHIEKPEYTGSKVSYHFCNGRNLPSAKEVKAVLPLFN